MVRLRRAYPAGQIVWNYAHHGSPYAADFRLPPNARAQLDMSKKFYTNFGDQIELIGFQINSLAVPPGGTLKAYLFWRAPKRVETNYTMSLQLIGPQYRAHGPELGGFGTLGLWAQSDSPPCQNTFPTSRWSVGDVVWDKYRLTLPASAPAGWYALRANVYDPAGGQRLPVLAADGSQHNNSVLITRILVKGP